MIKLLVLALSALTNFAFARPNMESVPQNVVTVPPNCPEGQQWVNGECRDIWIKTVDLDTKNVIAAPTDHVANAGDVKNVITVPPNCPTGQQWINGACRDVWMMIYEIIKYLDVKPINVVAVPPNCSVGQVRINGQCVDILRRGDNAYAPQSVKISKRQVDDTTNPNDKLPSINNRNIISVPNQCPTGYKPDALGYCRPVFD